MSDTVDKRNIFDYWKIDACFISVGGGGLVSGIEFIIIIFWLIIIFI